MGCTAVVLMCLSYWEFNTSRKHSMPYCRYDPTSLNRQPCCSSPRLFVKTIGVPGTSLPWFESSMFNEESGANILAGVVSTMRQLIEGTGLPQRIRDLNVWIESPVIRLWSCYHWCTLWKESLSSGSCMYWRTFASTHLDQTPAATNALCPYFWSATLKHALRDSISDVVRGSNLCQQSEE